ncbi:fungal-specific transcription factor domain-containing protein [Thelonectria olida]|uniref:Fungal-specific transcription factor domain-containing protein n=1 Tax=Thelonectria olida TaxID=1576542 RepID=A0A9P8W173_9HYPO|nr:fungal-specific transcription factor domain-containing protein [Thelonectria olida]
MFESPSPDPAADASRSISGRGAQPSPSRPRVEVTAAVSRTRRATRACDNCRRLKEKCNGGAPCDRCNKSGRQCIFTNAFRRTRNPQNPGPPRSKPPPTLNSVDPATFFEVERIRTLEHIVQHFTGIEQCTTSNLQEVVASLHSGSSSPHSPNQPGPAPSTNPPGYDEFSHSDFSRRVQQKMESQSEACQKELDYGVIAAQQLLSRDSVVQEAISLFPPSEVAALLLDVFFHVAQTNYFYVDEDLMRHKLSDFYAQTSPLTIIDAPWVCTTLMVFAVGTQFAHLASSDNSPTSTTRNPIHISSVMDDTLALAFFRKATSLVPDVLTIGSPQSVQAFGLLGIYALPLDPAGLSCTYFGIAIKIATHNGMHKKCLDHKTKEAEIRNRVWWTVYTLERRISILHGRPVSISRSEVDAEVPVDFPDLQPPGRVNTFHNVMAQRGITEIMADARDAILDLKKADGKKIAIMAQNVLNVKQNLDTLWGSLPEDIHCKDLTPGKPLFRSNIHLALTYHLVHIFIGRSFIFDESALQPGDSHVQEWVTIKDELIEDSVKSAVASIELCQILQDEFGLSKSSYTEFTSCCAAVLALVARRILTETSSLKQHCHQGVALLKNMSSGVFAKSCEKRGLEILEMALRKLDGTHRASPSMNGTGYNEFRNWVAMQQIVPGEDHVFPLVGWASESGPAPEMMGQGRMNVGQEFMPSTLADLSSLPGLDEWFQHSMG